MLAEWNEEGFSPSQCERDPTRLRCTDPCRPFRYLSHTVGDRDAPCSSLNSRQFSTARYDLDVSTSVYDHLCTPAVDPACRQGSASESMSRSRALEGVFSLPFRRDSMQVNLGIEPTPRAESCYRCTVARRPSGYRPVFFVGRATSWWISADRCLAGHHAVPLVALLRVLSASAEG